MPGPGNMQPQKQSGEMGAPGHSVMNAAVNEVGGGSGPMNSNRESEEW